MNNHQALKRNEEIRDGYQKIIDDLKRQIAEEEWPRVGDTVRIVPPYEYQWWLGEAVITAILGDNLGAWMEFKTGETAWLEYHRIKLVSRAALKPRRWYSQSEFITFMSAHPVILVRRKDGPILTGWPSIQEKFHYISGATVNNDNFGVCEYSTDGKTWQLFGVEE